MKASVRDPINGEMERVNVLNLLVSLATVVNSRYSERLYQRKMKWREIEQGSQCRHLASVHVVHTHGCALSHTHQHTHIYICIQIKLLQNLNLGITVFFKNHSKRI